MLKIRMYLFYVVGQHNEQSSSEKYLLLLHNLTQFT